MSGITLTTAAVHPIYDLPVTAYLSSISLSPGLPEAPQTNIPRVHLAIPPPPPDRFLDSRFGQRPGGGSAAATMPALGRVSRSLAGWTELLATPISHRNSRGSTVSFTWHATLHFGMTDQQQHSLLRPFLLHRSMRPALPCQPYLRLPTAPGLPVRTHSILFRHHLLSKSGIESGLARKRADRPREQDTLSPAVRPRILATAPEQPVVSQRNLPALRR